MTRNCSRSSAPIGAKILVHAAALLGGLTMAGPARAIDLFSAGRYATPETISLAPAGFGGFGGNYFIPDFNHAQLGGNIWSVAHSGGAPTAFATGADIIQCDSGSRVSE